MSPAISHIWLIVLSTETISSAVSTTGSENHSFYYLKSHFFSLLSHFLANFLTGNRLFRAFRVTAVTVEQTVTDGVRTVTSEKTIRERAEERGLPSSTARRRIHEARKLLKRLVTPR